MFHFLETPEAFVVYLEVFAIGSEHQQNMICSVPNAGIGKWKFSLFLSHLNQ